MSWKKYFKDANMSPISGDKTPNFAKRNYSSYLPDVYTGHPNRVQRYFQYDQMDTDSEINAALDILAEFCTQSNDENETPFDLIFKDDVTETEVKLLKKALQQWNTQIIQTCTLQIWSYEKILRFAQNVQKVLVCAP